ncbi:hypothetical protein AGLY_000773 [Aphis glycines]|uniref:Uncharacterized protein n=1 Tax=Aphis glycines TaxID=307491 RepID=A0A6G0U8Z2_APHGL|nr:hypothetical protein AGLY_000773 [Aphis glycines]
MGILSCFIFTILQVSTNCLQTSVPHNFIIIKQHTNIIFHSKIKFGRKIHYINITHCKNAIYNFITDIPISVTLILPMCLITLYRAKSLQIITSFESFTTTICRSPIALNNLKIRGNDIVSILEKKSPTHLAVIKHIISGKPNVMLPVASTRIIVKLIVILNDIPTGAPKAAAIPAAAPPDTKSLFSWSSLKKFNAPKSLLKVTYFTTPQTTKCNSNDTYHFDSQCLQSNQPRIHFLIMLNLKVVPISIATKIIIPIKATITPIQKNLHIDLLISIGKLSSYKDKSLKFEYLEKILPLIILWKHLKNFGNCKTISMSDWSAHTSKNLRLKYIKPYKIVCQRVFFYYSACLRRAKRCVSSSCSVVVEDSELRL